MTLVPIIVIVIILALVIIYVTRPLFIAQDETVDSSFGDNEHRIQAEYNAVLERIRELDFDFNLGKITPEEYGVQREEFLIQAATLHRELQAGDTAPSSPSTG